MNHSLEQPIGRGATAEIYAWEPGYILKLFHPRFNQGAVDYEARIARAVFASGLPVPAVGEVVQVNGRYGLVYQRVGGISMAQALTRRPWRLAYYARRLAELQVEMHTVPIQVDLPTQRARLAAKIAQAAPLPDRLREKALRELELLPQGDRLCHGDFHPENILVDGQKEIIIDWVDATLGHPLADVARTIIILRGVAEVSLANKPLLKAFLRRFITLYLRRYFTLRPGGEDVYRAYLPVIAAGRLDENIGELAPWLIEQVERKALTNRFSETYGKMPTA